MPVIGRKHALICKLSQSASALISALVRSHAYILGAIVRDSARRGGSGAMWQGSARLGAARRGSGEVALRGGDRLCTSRIGVVERGSVVYFRAYAWDAAVRDGLSVAAVSGCLQCGGGGAERRGERGGVGRREVKL